MRYRYRVQQCNGRIIKGVINANDDTDARLRLVEDGSILLSLTRCRAFFTLPAFVSVVAVNNVLKQLSLMLGSALPLKESLSMILKQPHSPHLRLVLEDVYRLICQGLPLSQAMNRHSRYFDSLCCAIIESGELSGDLPTGIRFYCEYMDDQTKLRNAVRQALYYPMLLSFISCVVVSVLLTVAVPKIVSQLSVSGISLPWSTRFILMLGELLSVSYPYVFIGTILLSLVIYHAHKRPLYRLYIHSKLLKIPFVGKLLCRVQQVRLLMTLSIFCVTAVPKVNALKLTSGAVSNYFLKDKISKSIQSLVEGAGFTQSLEKEELLPADLLALMHAGEQGGRLDEVIAYLAKNHREMLQQQLLSLVKLIEPLLIFILGFVVLLVFMAIIQPMLTMNSIGF